MCVCVLFLHFYMILWRCFFTLYKKFISLMRGIYCLKKTLYIQNDQYMCSTHLLQFINLKKRKTQKLFGWRIIFVWICIMLLYCCYCFYNLLHFKLYGYNNKNNNIKFQNKTCTFNFQVSLPLAHKCTCISFPVWYMNRDKMKGHLNIFLIEFMMEIVNHPSPIFFSRLCSVVTIYLSCLYVCLKNIGLIIY